MEVIDVEWPSINEVCKWVCTASIDEKNSVMLDLVMLLVHYMDSRFYNLERLKYVKHAVEAAKALDKKYEEALLMIDALGWTYVEENKFEEAVTEIKAGISIAEEIKAQLGRGNELLALGYSWYARARIEEGNKIDEAVALLNQARSYEENVKPWILFRVLMASGDIYLKKGEKERALIHYLQARDKMKDYGGEGNYYQINPRIGLAYLALDQLDDAEGIFKELAHQQKISIGKLYGEYGLALIKFKKKITDHAKISLQRIKDELTRRTSSNLLLNLITEFEKSLNVKSDPINLMPDKRNFNRYDNKTGLYILKNKNNLYMALTNYGARIVSLLVPDRKGQLRDIIIGPGTLQQFMVSNEPYFGATIGRFANRIADGKFKMDGVEYETPKNEKGKTTLHGGARGFQSVIWTVTELSHSSLQCHYFSPDGEEGFPGNLEVKVTFTLTDDNKLEIAYYAVSDKKTIVNLTNHAFINLNGQEQNKITNHIMQINAEYYTPVNNVLIPVGRIEPVAGTPFDFTQPVTIGARIDQYHTQINHASGYDHNFVLKKKEPAAFDFAARVFSEESNIQMEVFTNEPCLLFYSGNAMNGDNILKGGKTDHFRTAFVLEPHQYPDAPNQLNFPSAIIEPGQIFTSKSVYKFSILSP